ncbi:MAG: hypothetical protein RIQ81_1803 [Pseudomonadota bacterium]
MRKIQELAGFSASGVSLAGIALASVLGLAFACSPKGSNDSNSASLADMAGSVKSRTGSQADMANWTVMSLERQTNFGRSDLISESGTFMLTNVRSDRPRTIALLSPDHLLRSVLSIPTSSLEFINQYFLGTPSQLPPLFERGPIMIFGSLEGITPFDDRIKSDKKNGVPNAAYGDNGYGLIDNSSNVDLTGLPAVFNPDRNANGKLDIFETDVDSDGNGDASQGTGPNYFSEGLDYAAVQYELSTATGGTSTAQVTFVAKVKAGLDVKDVKIHGSSTLTSGSTTLVDGNSTAWDLTLADDGKSDDGVAADGIFARRVTLQNATALKGYEVILFEPRRADGAENPGAQPIAGSKFIVTAPPVSLSALSAPLWDPVTRTVNRVGSPFGTVTDYTWSVTVFDANNRPVYSSAAIAGSEDTVVLPDNAFDTIGTFTAKVTAKCQEQVPGYSFFVVTSPKVSL